MIIIVVSEYKVDGTLHRTLQLRQAVANTAGVTDIPSDQDGIRCLLQNTLHKNLESCPGNEIQMNVV